MIVDNSREPIQKLGRFRAGVTEYFRQDAATKVFALVVRWRCARPDGGKTRDCPFGGPAEIPDFPGSE
jgi:hypothetical protein